MVPSRGPIPQGLILPFAQAPTIQPASIDWNTNEHARWCAYRIHQCLGQAIQLNRQVEQAIYGMANENAYGSNVEMLRSSSSHLSAQLQGIYVQIQAYAAGILPFGSQEQRHAVIAEYLRMPQQYRDTLWLALLSGISAA